MLVIAHRGASGHAPENTMAAFRRALEMGAKAIEFDVHQTLDHELVIAHDDDLKRCGRQKGLMKNLHWEGEGETVDVGAWFDERFKGERLPRLEDLFDLVPPSVELHLEIKHGSAVYPGIEERVVDFIHHRGALMRTLVSSSSRVQGGEHRSFQCSAIRSQAVYSDRPMSFSAQATL